MDWKDEARMQYFDYKMSINEISRITGKSRKSVSAFLNSLSNFSLEKDKRKQENNIKRSIKAKEHMRNKRKETHQNIVDGHLLRRDHETAVSILSRERFFNE